MGIKKEESKSKRKLSIQTRLIVTFLFSTIIIFFVNMYMYLNLNQMIKRIDAIYVSNGELNTLQNSLNQVQSSLSEYLSTMSLDDGTVYYKSCQDYRSIVSGFNTEIINNESLIMEKNLVNMSETYLTLTDEIIAAKKDRNLEQYNALYEEAGKLHDSINTYIYSLNNLQFQKNTEQYDALYQSLTYMEGMNMLILAGTAVLSILLSATLTRGITKPLKQLAESANEVAKGNLDIEATEIDSLDEVDVVTTAFNKMVFSLQEYIDRLKQSMEIESEMKERELMMQAQIKDAQVRYLQAQINPHFLFNTLNAGVQLAMMEDAPRTYLYIQNVADFFRNNIKTDQRSVALKQEIALVDNYIYILNVRFSGDIHYEKHIDEKLVNIQVPNMILQPIVENAVNYGIRDIEWEGHIDLSVYRKEDEV